MILRDVLTKEFLTEEYVNKRRFARDIAREVGCSVVSVTNYLRKYGIKVETRYEERRGYLGGSNPAREIMTKEYLLREYVENNRSQTSISQELNCSITLVREMLIKHGIEIDKEKNHHFISSANNKFKNYITNDRGYILVYLPNHPKSGSRGYVRLHIILAEYYFNTTVKEGEVVHHKNGNRQDNRKENLEIMTKEEHDRLHAKLRSKNKLKRRNNI